MTIATGFRLVNYKSYKEEGAGFPEIKHINLIVGKNNIGKSALLEAIDVMCNVRTYTKERLAASVVLEETLSDDDLLRAFPEQELYSGSVRSWRKHGCHLLKSRIKWTIEDIQRTPGRFIAAIALNAENMTGEREEQISFLARGRIPTTNGLKHIRLAADRDIIPESAAGDFNLTSSGAGATRIIHQYIHHATKDRDLVQVRMLTALNMIFAPDLKFNEIITRYLEAEDKWEIFLGEEGKGVIALSQSGSGLKTVFLVLLNLLVIPEIAGLKIEKFIFSFEELENNLHPSLQRNLFDYLERFAVEFNTHFFLTTHSNVAIDMYANSQDAQILHVRRGDQGVYGVNYSSVAHGHDVLDDLGARASDLLQANGIIWVEGPSDRIFLNKWIDIWGGGAYREGHHYQFVFYGGSVLADISASTPEGDVQDAVNAMLINRNFIFVCDSDKRQKSDRPKKRVARLLKDVADGRNLVWVTKAREIENYIPSYAFNKVHGKTNLPEIDEYAGIQDYLVQNKLSRASEYRDKHAKAMKYSEYFTKENLAFRPELDEMMLQIVERIMRWNA